MGICSYCTPREPGRSFRARTAELEAEVARLEALIVRTVDEATGIDADLHAEAERIRSKP